MFEDELERLTKAGLLRKVYDRESGQGAKIKYYDGTDKILTFSEITEAPAALDTFIIV